LFLQSRQQQREPKLIFFSLSLYISLDVAGYILSPIIHVAAIKKRIVYAEENNPHLALSNKDIGTI